MAKKKINEVEILRRDVGYMFHVLVDRVFDREDIFGNPRTRHNNQDMHMKVEQIFERINPKIEVLFTPNKKKNAKRKPKTRSKN